MMELDRRFTRYRIRIARAAALATLGVFCPTTSALAQQTVADDHAASMRVASQLLKTPVTLAFDDVSLKRAVNLIAAAAGLRAQYQGTLLDAVTRPMSLHAKQLPVGEAFGRVLAGTGMQVVAVAPDIVVIQPATDRAALEGIVIGIVVDAKTKQPLVGVSVTLDAASRGVVTDDKGRFRLVNVSAGAHQLVLRRLGYARQTAAVTVTDGQVTPALTITLQSSGGVRLTEVVTTGAGDRLRAEVGNSSTLLNVDSIVRTTPIRNVSDLLKGRVSGGSIMSSSGSVGAGSRVRIRGEASLLANEDPVVIVDGVRYNALYTSVTAGPNKVAASTSNASNVGMSLRVPSASRLDDIDPESIESIEVLKGPAASALYGSDAANGVIVVKTKRGQSGPTRWSLSGELGRSTLVGKYAENYYGWGHVTGGDPYEASCTSYSVLQGYCALDSVTHYNPLNQDATSPYNPGNSQRLNGQVSGGSDKVQYFVGGSYNDELGVLHFPDALRARASTLLKGAALPSWANKPNELNSVSISSNLTTQLSHGDVALAVNGIRQYHRDVPQGDFGFVSMAQQVPGHPDTLGGWGTTEAAYSFLTKNDEMLSHGYGSLSGNWRPSSQLVLHATGGVDASTNDAGSLLMQNYIVDPGSDATIGSSHRNRMLTNIFTKTADANATWTYPATDRLQFVSTGGGQYTAGSNTNIGSDAFGLPLGSTTVSGATTVSSNEYSSQTATAGWYIQETMSLNRRLFITGAIRGDASSAFGSDAKAVSYPKWNASWLVSEEPFFPAIPALSSLRLRAAFGHAGAQPPFSARFPTFNFTSGYANGAAGNVITVRGIGNPDLQPEKSVEMEGGFDLGLGNDRLTLGLTVAHKTTSNALVNRTLPPSYGAELTQMQNVGKIFNSSFEMDATARPIDGQTLAWSTTVSFAQQDNHLVSLGAYVLPITGGLSSDVQQRYVAGYPIDGVWVRPILGYNDANGDGIITNTEIRLGDSAVYAGRGAPSKTLGWQNTLSFWSGRIAVGGNFTYENGATQQNSVLRRLCQMGACRGSVDTTASDFAQVLGNASSVWPFLETISVFRFQEFSLTYNAPIALARRFRAQSASVSLLGQNLKLWSHYRGLDPDVNSNPTGDRVEDYGAVPSPRQWFLRVRLGF